MDQKPPETSLGQALRHMAQGTRLSSLDVPLLEDAADRIDYCAGVFPEWQGAKIRRSVMDYSDQRSTVTVWFEDGRVLKLLVTGTFEAAEVARG